VFQDLVRLRPDDGRHWGCYGRLLKDRGDSAGAGLALEKAGAALREAIRLKPDDAGAHNNLGNALNNQGKLPEAIAEYRAAIRIRPDLATVHNNLGYALRGQGKLDEAIAEYREAIRLRPDFAEAHGNLGNALHRQGKLDEAIAACREAIRIRPDLAAVHNDLGGALRGQGKLDEAIAEYREAIRLKPDLAAAHNNLGNALRDQGKLAEAIAEFREAIRLKPDDAEPHFNLGLVLRQQGRFRESLGEVRKGHELGSKQPDWRHPSAEWVRQAERLVALETRLPAVIRGDDQPKDGAEGLVLADMAYKAGRYSAAARLHARAFESDPKLVEDMNAHNRYNAACAAALVGAGRGEDPPTDEAEKARWRKRAVAWLRADLAFWTKQVEVGPPQAKAFVIQTLRHWKDDADLAGLRDEAALKALLEEEQKACRALWAEVDALLRKVQGP
jgi:tetratricopeptide (TPR) repeat protein